MVLHFGEHDADNMQSNRHNTTQKVVALNNNDNDDATVEEQLQRRCAAALRTACAHFDQGETSEACVEFARAVHIRPLLVAQMDVYAVALMLEGDLSSLYDLFVRLQTTAPHRIETRLCAVALHQVRDVARARELLTAIEHEQQLALQSAVIRKMNPLHVAPTSQDTLPKSTTSLPRSTPNHPNQAHLNHARMPPAVAASHRAAAAAAAADSARVADAIRNTRTFARGTSSTTQVPPMDTDSNPFVVGIDEVDVNDITQKKTSSNVTNRIMPMENSHVLFASDLDLTDESTQRSQVQQKKNKTSLSKGIDQRRNRQSRNTRTRGSRMDQDNSDDDLENDMDDDDILSAFSLEIEENVCFMLLRARNFTFEGNISAAIDDFEALLRLNKGIVYGYEGLVASYLELRDTTTALQYAEEIGKAMGNSPRVMILAAKVLDKVSEQEPNDFAANLLLNAIVQPPIDEQDPVAREVKVGDVLQDVTFEMGPTGTVRPSLCNNSNVIEACLTLSQMLESSDKHEEACNLLENALLSAPSPSLHLRLAEIRLEMGEFGRAFDEVNTAFMMDPENEMIQERFALVLRAMESGVLESEDGDSSIMDNL